MQFENLFLTEQNFHSEGIALILEYSILKLPP